MPSDKIQKIDPICIGVQIPEIIVPASSFVSHECALSSVTAGQRVGVSASPEGVAQSDGVHIMNSYCMTDGILTIQFNNTNKQDASVKPGVYVAHIEQGAQNA